LTTGTGSAYCPVYAIGVDLDMTQDGIVLILIWWIAVVTIILVWHFVAERIKP